MQPYDKIRLFKIDDCAVRYIAKITIATIMHVLRAAFIVLMGLSGSLYADGQGQVVLTVTGTVDSGTDGNPNSTPPGAGHIFGGGGDLSGEPFTLTFTFNISQGTSFSDACSDGTISQSGNSGSGTSSGNTGILRIGQGSFSIGTLPLGSLAWSTRRQGPASCTNPDSEIGFGWDEQYAGSYSGQTGIASVNLYTSSSLPNGDWTSSIPLTAVIPDDFQFSITVQSGSELIAYAQGELKAATVTVTGPQATCSVTGNAGLANISSSATGTCPTQPEILLAGVNITNTTQPAVVGQEIMLTALLPAGAVLAEQPWAGIDPIAAIGGYVVAFDFSTARVLPLNLTGASIQFYWITPDVFNVSLTCILNNGDIATAKATFNVQGPTSAMVQLTPGQVQINNNELDYGVSGGYGITFDASPTPSSPVPGMFQWVQVIDDSTVVVSGSLLHRTCVGVRQTELDKEDPYPATTNGLETHDSPAWNLPPLPSLYSTFSVTWSARMFFMWLSATPSTCDPIGLCTFIQVPLGYAAWSVTANAQVENQIWQKVSETESQSFSPILVYPTWSGIALPSDSEKLCFFELGPQGHRP